MKEKDILKYDTLEIKDLKDINALGYVLKHKKSGARVIFIETDDNNKTFSIGFRTPPVNNTGVAHIMEHSVLCGSKKFPVKDPFMELAKGSLNTFLNAMTYPDKTVYPVSSTNKKDFQNLMDVYLDAVFNPAIYLHEEIFCQEGITYSLDSKDSDLIYNGVVYNEMKGAFSSPDDVLDRIITESLFPDNCYGVESGGDPDYIPELTYNEFLDFHRKYYHPSNSYIYLYGDMDRIKTLEWLDKEYLSQYSEQTIESEIKYQPVFKNMVEKMGRYSISESEKIEDNTYLSYNFVVGDILDRKLYLAFQILEYAILSMPGSPIKKALLEAGIGKDVSGRYNNEILQPFFTIIAKNANPKDKDRFINIIKNEFENLYKNGVDRNSLLAALNNYEFQYRENDFGSYPKGLIFSFQVFDSWLYDDKEPFRHLNQGEIFNELRKALETDYYEQLIKEYFIENNHCSVVVVEPEVGLTNKKDKELSEKLSKIKEAMNEDEINQLVKKTKELREYKKEPSSKEDLERIPLLKIDEISKEVEAVYNTEKSIDSIKVIQHDIFTNGIGYGEFYFDVTEIPFEALPYLSLLKGVFAYMDTNKHTFSELSNEIGINTGGIYGDIIISRDVEDFNKYRLFFVIRTKVFFNSISKAIELIKEIVSGTLYNNSKRLYEILCEGKSNLQATLLRSGDAAAVTRNLSYFSKTAAINEKLKGISFYKFVENIVDNYEIEKENIISILERMSKYVFRKDNLIISYTANNQGFEKLIQPVKEFVECLKEKNSDSFKEFGNEIPCVKKNEGIKTSSQVQYVTRAGNFVNKGFAYDGSLKVLRTILSYEYLWSLVRVEGGAYGCSSAFGKSGEGYFSSYRDPNLKETNRVFEGIPNFVSEFSVDERDMRKYIIGTISSMDTPLTAMAKGRRSMAMYFNNDTVENQQKERMEVLETNEEKIRSLSPLMQAIIDDKSICVVGNEGKIQKDLELFDNTINLFEK